MLPSNSRNAFLLGIVVGFVVVPVGLRAVNRRRVAR